MPVTGGPEDGVGATVIVDGVTYTVGADGKWPPEALDALERRRPDDGMSDPKLARNPAGNPYDGRKPLPPRRTGPPPAPAVETAPPWTPSRPPDELLLKPIAGNAWPIWFQSLGYTPGEIAELLSPPAGAPGFETRVRKRARDVATARARAGEPVTGEPEQLAVLAGAVVEDLAARPPAKVLGYDHRPSMFLDDQAFGRRLEYSGYEAPGRVRLFTDQVDGSQWWARAYREADHAGTTVVAATLYAQLGTAAPAVRLAEVLGTTYAVHPALVAWGTLDQAGAKRWADEGSRSLPVDAWLGNSGGPSTFLCRAIAEGPGLLRFNLTSCLAFQGELRDPGWVADNLLEFNVIPSPMSPLERTLYQPARDDPAIMRPMAYRIQNMGEDLIREALDRGRLPARQRAALFAALIGRRELVLGTVNNLVTSAAPKG